MARIFTDAGGQALASANQTLADLDTFSIAFWINRTATPAAARGIIGIGDATGWNIGLTTANLIQAVAVYSGATDKVRNSTTAPALNTWTHVVVTYNQTGLLSTDFTFYFNGKSEVGTNISSGVTARVHGAAPLTIGSGIGTLLAPPAQIGGPVAVWSRAISPAEALALAGGMHPLRFKEGLVDLFDLNTAHGEEGWLAKLYLVQGATNPSSAAVSPALEQMPSLIEDTRLNVRPMVRSRARYMALGSGPITFNALPAIQNWLVAASVLAAAVTLPATPVVQSWVVPGGTISAARTLAATPSTQAWTVPAATLTPGGITLSPTPAIQTWGVPAASLAAARTLTATPPVQNWTVPAATLFVSGGAVTFNATPAVQTWTVPAALLSANRTLAATPATQTWSIPGATVSTARTLQATPSVQMWVVPGGSVSGLTVTFTFRVQGGPVMTASIAAQGVLAARVSGGPVLTETITGGPV